MRELQESRKLACDPTAIALDQRVEHVRLIGRLFARGVSRNAIPGGYRFDFPSEAFDDVARFVGNERRCCPFLEFWLFVYPDEDSIALEITGPPGTEEFLRIELMGSED
jgi:hypothetical protein